MASEPIQPQDKYVLRMPDGMRDALKAAAAANNRSMNAEIVARLQSTFNPANYPNRDLLGDMTMELEKSDIEQLRYEVRTVIKEFTDEALRQIKER